MGKAQMYTPEPRTCTQSPLSVVGTCPSATFSDTASSPLILAIPSLERIISV